MVSSAVNLAEAGALFAAVASGAALAELFIVATATECVLFADFMLTEAQPIMAERGYVVTRRDLGLMPAELTLIDARGYTGLGAPDRSARMIELLKLARRQGIRHVGMGGDMSSGWWNPNGITVALAEAGLNWGANG